MLHMTKTKKVDDPRFHLGRMEGTEFVHRSVNQPDWAIVQHIWNEDWWRKQSPWGLHKPEKEPHLCMTRKFLDTFRPFAEVSEVDLQPNSFEFRSDSGATLLQWLGVDGPELVVMQAH